MSVTTGFPSVIVPVLSSKIESTLCRFSKLSAFLNNSPSSADLPVATMIAIGVARPRAHGHDITSTEIIRFNANSKSLLIIYQPTKVINDIIITAGTKTAEILSASFAIGALVSFASFTRLMIWERVVSSPTLVALNLKEPCLLIVAEITSSPIVLVTGIDSPVIAASSTREDPSIISPSTGILSPGLITIMSPFSISVESISTSLLFLITLALSGAKSIRFFNEALVSPLLLASKYFPSVINVRIIAEDSK